MRVRTRVGELSIEDVGEGPAVVLWHSYLHHGGMWRAQVEALRTRYRVINVDAPGHGRSESLARVITMDDCADAVAELLDARGVDRAAFCGLSWGGMTAMAFSIRHPARLTAMALFDTSAREEKLKNRIEYRVLGTIFRTLGAVPALMDKVEKLFFCQDTLRDERAMVDAWRAYVSRMDRQTVWNALQCIVRRRDVRDELARVRVPTLIGVGDRDLAQPREESEAIAAAIPGAKLFVVRNAGHLSALERPREVNERLLAFLGEVTHASASTRATG